MARSCTFDFIPSPIVLKLIRRYNQLKEHLDAVNDLSPIAVASRRVGFDPEDPPYSSYSREEIRGICVDRGFSCSDSRAQKSRTKAQLITILRADDDGMACPEISQCLSCPMPEFDATAGQLILAITRGLGEMVLWNKNRASVEEQLWELGRAASDIFIRDDHVSSQINGNIIPIMMTQHSATKMPLVLDSKARGMARKISENHGRSILTKAIEMLRTKIKVYFVLEGMDGLSVNVEHWELIRTTFPQHTFIIIIRETKVRLAQANPGYPINDQDWVYSWGSYWAQCELQRLLEKNTKDRLSRSILSMWEHGLNPGDPSAPKWLRNRNRLLTGVLFYEDRWRFRSGGL